MSTEQQPPPSAGYEENEDPQATIGAPGASDSSKDESTALIPFDVYKERVGRREEDQHRVYRLISSVLESETTLREQATKVRLDLDALKARAADEVDAHSAPEDKQRFRDAADDLDGLWDRCDRRATRRVWPLQLLVGLCLVAAGMIFVFTLRSSRPRSWFFAHDGVTNSIIGTVAFAIFFVIAAILTNGRRRASQFLWTREAPPLVSQLAAANASFDRALKDTAILRWLRTQIARKADRSYETTLPFMDIGGLAELPNPEHEVPTEAKARLSWLLKNMAAGSIGLAGPRGSGKSTLIAAFCQPQPLDESPSEVLRIMASAPVKYEARDFTLHLFARVCQAVLGGRGEMPPPLILGRGEVLRKRLPTMLRAISISAIVLGLLLVSFDLADVNVDSALVWAVALLMAGSVLLIANRPSIFSDALRSWFGIGPVPRPALQGNNETMTKAEGARQNLRAKADDWLKVIRFQQSYASGWSGSLSLPIGLEVGRTGTTTISENQRSVPEIIDGYRSFLRDASGPEPKPYRQIRIGIDEMDKIQSEDDAQQFLNEMKALFNLPYCFYLISVSENAMSSFERRGIPFRDAFDSSFDEVIRVGYLDLDLSRGLLQERLVGLPESYIALCHCMAGGLARDLIRVARAIFEVAEDGAAARSLSTICSALVSQDLRGKTEASIVAAKRLPTTPEVKGFLDFLGRRRRESLVRQDLASDITDLGGPILGSSGVSSSPGEVIGALQALTQQFAGFSYYCLTMLDFFNDELDEDTLRKAEAAKSADGGLDQLAHARQAFELEPQSACQTISRFRVARGLDEDLVVELPPSSTGHPDKPPEKHRGSGTGRHGG